MHKLLFDKADTVVNTFNTKLNDNKSIKLPNELTEIVKNEVLKLAINLEETIQEYILNNYINEFVKHKEDIRHSGDAVIDLSLEFARLLIDNNTTNNNAKLEEENKALKCELAKLKDTYSKLKPFENNMTKTKKPKIVLPTDIIINSINDGSTVSGLYRQLMALKHSNGKQVYTFSRETLQKEVERLRNNGSIKHKGV